MRILKIFLAISTIFSLASLSSTPVLAPVPVPTDVRVPRLQIPVDLDGIITGDEWSDAVMLSTYFHFYNITTMEYLGNRSAIIYLKHDCVRLWICVQIEDPIENVTVWDDYPSGEPSVYGDLMWIFYDVSGDTTYGAGDDEKAMLHPDFTMDVALIPDPPYYAKDTDLGGTKDVQGASGWADGIVTYELVHPLNSEDSLGNDPALEPGDSILAQFFAIDPEFDFEDTYGSTGLYNLITTECPTPVGGAIVKPNRLEILAPVLTPLIAASAATTLVVVAMKMKKKEADQQTP